MLKEIHLAGSVGTPFGSFCGAFADVSAVELGKAAVEREHQRRPPPNAARQTKIRGHQMNFPILINLLPLFGFTLFVVLPVSLAYIVEWIIRYWFR